MAATTTLKRCPLCSYRLDGLPAEHRCPECGFTYDQDTHVFKASNRENVIAMVLLGTTTLILLGISLAKGGFNRYFLCIIIGPMLLSTVGYAVRLLRKNRTLVILSKADLCVRRKGRDIIRLDRTELVAAEYSTVTGNIDVRTSNGWRDFPLNVRFFGTNKRSKAFVRTVNKWAQTCEQRIVDRQMDGQADRK